MYVRDNEGIKLMRKQGFWKGASIMLAIALVIVSGASSAYAVTSSSNNYQLTETQFSSAQKSCSGQYCTRASFGEASNGAASASATAKFEDITGNEPLLDMIVTPGSSNLGVLTTQATATKITSIKVRSYLIAGGYSLQIIGNAPKFGGHTLATPTVPTSSVPGTEMFGINVVANSTPNIGADPVQTPTGQQIFGKATDNYKTANKFMYQSQDAIARSQTDSGQTDYTVSMVVNISSSTPAGKYSGEFTAMLVPAY